MLLQAGAQSIKVFDPKANSKAKDDLERRLEPKDMKKIHFAGSIEEACNGSDVLITATDWEEFRELTPDQIKGYMGQGDKPIYVFDGRQLFDPEVMSSAGIKFYSIGRPYKKL